jgi:ADP-L-glycero-D-manno-heptose 6-epimerase
MRILVTGGAGFIGSNLALTLEQQGHKVTVLDDFSSGHFENLDDFKGDVIAVDVVDAALEKISPDAEIIFHQAAMTDTTITDQYRMMRVNVEGFRNVLEFALKRKIRLVYASSAGVYGNGKNPMKEDQVPKPLNCYAFSKSVTDNIAREVIEKRSIPIIGLRYFNVFGPREEYKGKAASMIYQLAQQMKQNKCPCIFTGGEQKRDHIYVKDVVVANLRAMSAKKNGIVNVGSGAATTFNRVIEILNEVLKTDLAPDYFENPYTGVYQNETLADTGLAQELIGFRAKYSVEDGIRDYLKVQGTLKK